MTAESAVLASLAVDTVNVKALILHKTETMKAIEISSKTDSSGLLKIDYNLNKSNSRVRVLILLDDDKRDEDDEVLWMQSISANPAFDFLNDPAEDIYSITDGEPIDD